MFVRIGKARIIILATMGAIGLSLLAPLGGTAAAAETGDVLIGAEPVASPGVSAKPAPGPVQLSRLTGPALTLRPKDPAAAAKRTDNSTDSYVCTPFVGWGFSGVGEDDFLEETVDVYYDGGVDCNFYLASIEGISGVFDRSPSFNGQSFNGLVLGTGTYFYNEWYYTGYSFGGFGVRARTFNGARSVEPAIELYLWAPEMIWGGCDFIPGLRYLACDGLGTDYLHVVMGAYAQSTGLTRACRDQNAALDPEEARLTATAGGVTTPVSTRILRVLPAIKNLVTSFKRDLCSVSSGTAAGAFATQRGQQLWDTAVSQAKNNAAQGDDRPLYWARLSMTAAFTQWRPTFTVPSGLTTTLDRASRGFNSHTFTLATTKRVIVSGFDPFGLTGSDVLRGNPSGAAALKLDGTLVNGAEVQAVIFPVRYKDFNNRIVEDVFATHLSGTQRANLAVTFSQGGSRFELEYYNGRRRSSTFPDNRDRTSGGTFTTPVEPGGLDPGAEFIATTLPVNAMLVGSPYGVIIDTSVYEQSPPGSPTQFRENGPTPGSLSVEGSGGGFLSNEVAYRVTRYRVQLGSTTAAGHVHTPALSVPIAVPDSTFDGVRNAIVAQSRQILEAAVAAV